MLIKQLLYTKCLLKHKTTDLQCFSWSYCRLSGSTTRPIPPPHAGGEVLSAQILQTRKCQTTEGHKGAEISWLCATPCSNVACNFRQALTAAPHSKSISKCRQYIALKICNYIEYETVTCIRRLCFSCPKEVLPTGKK